VVTPAVTIALPSTTLVLSEEASVNRTSYTYLPGFSPEVIEDPKEIFSCPSVAFGKDTTKLAAVVSDAADFFNLAAPVNPVKSSGAFALFSRLNDWSKFAPTSTTMLLTYAAIITVS